LWCRLEDGEFLSTGFTVIMFHGCPQMRRVDEIIERVVEVVLYNYWISLFINKLNYVPLR